MPAYQDAFCSKFCSLLDTHHEPNGCPHDLLPARLPFALNKWKDQFKIDIKTSNVPPHLRQIQEDSATNVTVEEAAALRQLTLLDVANQDEHALDEMHAMSHTTSNEPPPTCGYCGLVGHQKPTCRLFISYCLMKKAADADPKSVAEVQNTHTKVSTFARRPPRQQQHPSPSGRGGQQQRARFATNRVRRLQRATWPCLNLTNILHLITIHLVKMALSFETASGGLGRRNRRNQS